MCSVYKRVTRFDQIVFVIVFSHVQCGDPLQVILSNR